MLKKIETQRLVIRPVQLGDEFQIHKAINNSLDLLQKWQPWAQDPRLEVTREFVQRGLFAWESGSIASLPMVVIHKADNKIIAATGYCDRSNIAQRLYEIGYWCDLDYQGKGYVTEYVNALTRYALVELNAKIVVVRMEEANSKSIAVAERLRFKNQGIQPSVIKGGASDYYYTCESVESLPSLDVKWEHVDSNANAKMIAWARNSLNILEEQKFSEGRVLLKTPWSLVITMCANFGPVYLKCIPAQLALEPYVFQYLKSTLNASVPEVIAVHPNLNCFLTKDAGVTLRSILKKKFDVGLICRAIEQFTEMQVNSMNNIAGLLELGVPDWRLDKLPTLFANFLEQEELLIQYGVLEHEILNLKLLLPRINLMCVKLASINISEALVQCDFHDNNILFSQDTNSFTFIDLGEVVISHPFFSLLGCLWQMQKHYHLKEHDINFVRIKQACLKRFIVVYTEDKVRQAFEIASGLWYLYGVLAQYRLIIACEKNEILQKQPDKLRKSLKDFSLICKNI